MTNSKKLILTAFAVAVLLRGATAAEFFGRPALWHADYDASGFAAKVGPAIEVGGYLGTSGHHALGVEAARLPWTKTLAASELGAKGDGHLVPLLASYRYEFREASARWGVYVGASAGVTKVSGRIETLLSGVAYSGDVGEWTTTLVGTLGVSAAVTPRISVDLAFRYLHLEAVDYSTRLFAGTGGFTGGSGPTRAFPATRAGIVSLGLTLRF